MAEISDYSGTAASNNAASPNGWPEGMAPSGVNDSDREFAARIRRWYADLGCTITTAGSSNAYTFAASRTISAYAAGQVFFVVFDRANTGSATLNVDSVGAKALVKPNGDALASGDIAADMLGIVAYDATNDEFQLISPLAATSGVTGSGNNTWTGVNTFSGEAKLAKPSLPASTELTIASGSITPTQSHHTVDTESDASSDDLATIVTTNIPDNGIIMLRPENTGRTVNVKDSSTGGGNIETMNGKTFSMSEAVDTIWLQRRGASWYEVIPRNDLAQIATQAEVAAATLTLSAIPPAYAHAHPSAAKARGSITAGGTTVNAGYNVTGVARNAAGDYTVTLDNDMDSATYQVLASLTVSANVDRRIQVKNKAAGSFDLNIVDDAGSLSETSVSEIDFVVYGTLA